MEKDNGQNPIAIAAIIIALIGGIYFFSQHSERKTLTSRSKNSQSGNSKTGKTSAESPDTSTP